jgi:hypothetical protein
MQKRVACANNLRQYWSALAVYADHHEGDFPRVETQGPRAVAGIFVPVLRDAGLAKDVSIGCPAKKTQAPLTYTVAELEHLHAQSPTEYRRVAKNLSGHYAYCLGYQDGATHMGLRRTVGDGLPILADRAIDVHGNSDNHGGQGQNVLFVGGNVRWATQPTVGMERDNIFVNHHNRVQAGVTRIDSVLGSSGATPYGEE